MLTLGDARNSTIKNIAGVVPTSQAFSDYVNEAVRRLLRRGDFKGTIVPIQVCIGMGCVTWPRIVGSVRKIHTCRGNIKVRNQWYQFLEYKHNHRYWRDLRDHECVAAAIGEVSTYNDMPGDGWAIRVYADRKEDVGQSVTIFGIDNNGQRIQTQNTDGSWSDGMQIVILQPWSQTTFNIRTLERVVKTVTQGPVRLYAVAASDGSMLDLAVYQPTETTPAYERYQISRGGINSACWCSSAQVGSVVALVKLRYIPAVVDTDLLAIDNLDGLKMEIMAIKREEAGDDAGYRTKEQDAVHECNRDMENAYPEEQTTTRYETFANTWVGGQQCY